MIRRRAARPRSSPGARRSGRSAPAPARPCAARRARPRLRPRTGPAAPRGAAPAPRAAPQGGRPSRVRRRSSGYRRTAPTTAPSTSPTTCTVSSRASQSSRSLPSNSPCASTNTRRRTWWCAASSASPAAGRQRLSLVGENRRGHRLHPGTARAWRPAPTPTAQSRPGSGRSRPSRPDGRDPRRRSSPTPRGRSGRRSRGSAAACRPSACRAPGAAVPRRDTRPSRRRGGSPRGCSSGRSPMPRST